LTTTFFLSQTEATQKAYIKESSSKQLGLQQATRTKTIGNDISIAAYGTPKKINNKILHVRKPRQHKNTEQKEVIVKLGLQQVTSSKRQ